MRIPLVSPTALTLAEHVSRAVGREVFVKHENATHPRYGGNKVRKLEYLLADARARGATDLVTVGAAGSHHVLATTVHGTAAGFRVEAVLAPQPRSAHVVDNLRADLAQGATLYPVAHGYELPLRLAWRAAALRAQGRVAYVIPPGGSTALGACGYIDAVAELRQQLATVGVGSVDAMVCALGSGGTLAGLMAGQRLHGVSGEAWGVRVTPRVMSDASLVAWLANGAMDHMAPRGVKPARVRRAEVRIVHDASDPGYGVETRAARHAIELFAKDDVHLDATYTGKAAAALVAMARSGPRRARYLFWNTLSSAPLSALTPDPEAALPGAIEALLA